jgi:collagenase-like PrtC family protease
MTSTSMVNQPRIALSIGPVAYYWTRAKLGAFYAELADSAAQTICLGEMVCSRRHEMSRDDWLALARELRQCGKEVTVASQALIESEAELRELRRWVEQGEYMIEANDAAAVHLLAGRAPWVIGTHVNVYSAPALAEYTALGAVRWVPPVELALEAMAQVNGAGGAVATEAFAFGRLPLALSARCFTARHLHLQKDVCDFRCIEHPDGLTLRSREGQPFLALNGIQTQSAAVHCLIRERETLLRAGITRLRLSPTASDFARVVDLFDGVMNRGESVDSALRELVALRLPGALADGYAHARRAGMTWSASA